MSNETCGMCKMPMVCGHSIGIDGARILIRLCCLCLGELLGKVNSELVSSDE